MDKLYWLNQIQMQDRAQVGDQAFHLSKLMQRGYPVVPGFAITTDIFREFLVLPHLKPTPPNRV